MAFFKALGDWLWGGPLLAAFLVVGLWYSFGSGFFQVFGLPAWWSATVGSLLRRKKGEKQGRGVTQFQALSTGGAISYVEVPNMQNNIPAVLQLIRYIYDNIMYAELNTKSDFCQECGFDGEIRIVTDDSGKLVWECPNCGNRNQDKMNVARRTCGYIGTQYWNQGRTQEIKDRVLHL